jgi:hypothetical protein
LARAIRTAFIARHRTAAARPCGAMAACPIMSRGRQARARSASMPFFRLIQMLNLDVVGSAVCESLATLAILHGGVGLLGGLIVAMLWEVVPGATPGLRWRRALLIGTAMAMLSLAGLVTMRARVCG